MALPEPQTLFFNNQEFQIDQYSPYDYKGVLSTRFSTGNGYMAPTWVGSHRRRIQAYNFIAAYDVNAARMLLEVTNRDEQEARNARREYGDAGLIVEQIKSSLLGDQQSVVVEGADEFDPSKPKAPSEPIDDSTVDDEIATAQAAFERQQFLRQWADDERLSTKMVETERNDILLGDGVYSLGIRPGDPNDPTTDRVVLRTWDPACYFPVLDTAGDSQFPRRVNIAWQLVEDDPRPGYIRVRKITYYLLDGVPPYSVPWSDKPVTEDCYMSDGIYTLTTAVKGPDDFDLRNVEWMTDLEGPIVDRALGIDFIPVIHIPNTVAETGHYGTSSLAKVIQILDDIQATDSDLQAASEMTGSPMLALSGDAIQSDVTVGPRKALRLGPNGRADIISGADGLTGLAQYRDDLRRLLSVNARVPEAVLGRVDPGQIQAGIVLALSFGPLSSMIDEMRLVRSQKYRLLLKFVQRFYLKQGTISGTVMDADVLFGSYLPSDRAGVIDAVTKLYAAKLISRPTAMAMLQEVGVPIEDVAAEAKEIDHRDYQAAQMLLDATGDPRLVAEFLDVRLNPTVLTAAVPNQQPQPQNQPPQQPQQQPQQQPGNQN